MKWKKAAAAAMAAVMTMSLAACGGSDKSGGGEATDVKYSDIKLGEDYTDLKADIKLLTNRTDMMDADYAGKNWDAYLEEFNKEYPDINVEIEGITDYAEDSLLRLQGGDWGDIMMIPEVDKSDLSSYFLSYGDVDSVSEEVKYPDRWLYDNEVYGIPCTVVGRGIVYNKKVFADAGITETPKTPEEFIDALKAIKDNTDATPLYTNYAAGWTMGAWDDYTAATATGDAKFRNQELAHAKAPFADPGDGTGAYNVYKILYDAVSEGLTEDDYSTTDWEGSKSMLNSGKVGCMVLGSWAYPQMQQAGDTPDDVGYMPFPMTVDGKLYSPADEDYCFGINIDSDADKQTAAMVFVKWMTEKSGYSYNEGGLPIAVGDEEYPEVYQEFIDNEVEFISNEPAVEGEEDLLNEMNAESELMVGAGGNDKVQAIVEHAANKDMSFDEIMDEWNQKWSDAQENLGVDVK
ncbi:MAG: ABC transporter substrate-binding protein [Bariatricus sp.]